MLEGVGGAQTVAGWALMRGRTGWGAWCVTAPAGMAIRLFWIKKEDLMRR